MYMLDFVFHLSIDRHLGYVHFLAAAMNIECTNICSSPCFQFF